MTTNLTIERYKMQGWKRDKSNKYFITLKKENKRTRISIISGKIIKEWTMGEKKSETEQMIEIEPSLVLN